jgi:hypothetical protein
MKRTHLFVSIVFLAWLAGTSNAQTITPEERQYIIADLDSVDILKRGNAVRDVIKYDIAEAIPILEAKFWGWPTTLQFGVLDALVHFNSPNLGTLAHAMIDSAEFLANRLVEPGGFREPYDALRIRARASYGLLKIGDYSSVQHLLQDLERGSSHIFPHVLEMLKILAINAPQYAQQAKHHLVRLSREAYLGIARGAALHVIAELYGSEICPDLVGSFQGDTAHSSNRILAMELLFQLDCPNLNNLLRERLSQETAWSYRTDIADSLLFRYGTISDYRFVQDYLPFEPHSTARSIMITGLEGFRPPQPKASVPLMEMFDTLHAQIIQTMEIAWLGENNFVNELGSHIQNAKTYLDGGDSLSSASQIELFQQKVDAEYRDSLDGDNRFVTVEGWKFLFYNAQYILDRLPAIPSLTTYSLFATHSMHLEQNSKVFSGDIGVNDAGSPPFLDSQVELSIGIGVTTAAGSSIKAHRIKVKSGATVHGSIHYNTIENNGTITGTQHTPLPLPLVATLPEFKSATPGTQNILVPQGGSQTLPPGTYGGIEVRKNGRLTLTGGEYHVASLTAGDDVRLVFQGPTNVRVAGKFDSGQGSFIGPEDTTLVSADKIMFHVGGINGTNGTLGATPKAAKIGIGNRVWASFYVPNGTLWIRQNSEATGQFIGKDVDVGIGVKVWKIMTMKNDEMKIEE